MDMNSWTKDLLGFLPTVFQPWEDTAYPKLISWRSTPVAFLSQTISRCVQPRRRTANRDCEAAMRLRFQDCATRFGGLPSAFVVSVLRCRREEAWREVASGMILCKFKNFQWFRHFARTGFEIAVQWAPIYSTLKFQIHANLGFPG